jgi:hypothetical protein
MSPERPGPWGISWPEVRSPLRQPTVYASNESLQYSFRSVDSCHPHIHTGWYVGATLKWNNRIIRLGSS